MKKIDLSVFFVFLWCKVLKMNKIMKTKKILLLMFMGMAFMALAKCNECNDDGNFPQKSVPEAIRKAFEKKFPEQMAKWEADDGLVKAEFWKNSLEMEVWFTWEGEWVRTEREVSVYNLPEPVKTTIKSKFPDYRIGAPRWVETPQDSFYEMEIKRRGAPDIYVKISKNGGILQEFCEDVYNR